MAGTQNLRNTAQQFQQTNDNENKMSQKEDFMRVPSSQSEQKLNDSESIDERASSPTETSESKIENMTREAGDGQNDNGIENTD